MQRLIMTALCMIVLASARAGGSDQGAAVELLLDSAARYVEQAEYDQAAVALERALRIEPTEAEIWHLLGQVRLHQGQYSQAEAMAQKSNALAADKVDLQQRNQHLIHVARELSGQPAGPTQLAATDSGVRPDYEPKPLATATQPVLIKPPPERPAPAIVTFPPPPPVALPVHSDDVAYESDVQTVQLIYDPSQDRIDDRDDEDIWRGDARRDDARRDDARRDDARRDDARRESVPIVNRLLAGGLLQVELLLRDLQRYRSEREAFKIKFKPKKFHQKHKRKKHKKHKKRGRSRDRD